MMFSSNQILAVSGCITHPGELENALEFALKASGYIERFTRAENPLQCVYQITEDGRYCIGCAYGEIEEGWNAFPFDFDLSIISQIITKHLQKQKVNYDGGDGSYHEGFIMEKVPKCYSSEYKGIKSPSDGIVLFKPYTCYYSK